MKKKKNGFNMQGKAMKDEEAADAGQKRDTARKSKTERSAEANELTFLSPAEL